MRDRGNGRSASLRPLVGTWETHGEVVAKDGTTTATIRGFDTYEWLGRHFVIHRAEVRMGRERVQVLEVIGPYDPKRKAFLTRAYDSRGESHASTASVDEDGVWTFRAAGAKATLRIAEDGRTMRATWVRTGRGNAGGRPWMHLHFARGPADRIARPARPRAARAHE